MRNVFSLAVSASCLLACSQGKSDAATDCDGLTVQLTLQAASDRWPAGAYDLTVTQGDTIETCTLTITDDETQRLNADGSCDHGSSLSFSSNCSGSNEGCQLNSAWDKLLFVRHDASPGAELTARLSKDGEQVLSGDGALAEQCVSADCTCKSLRAVMAQ